MNEKKKNVLAKENAILEFDKMVKEFNFNISTETKEKVITMKVNNIDMSTSQESAEADTFISKIMEGKIKYDGDSKKIIYVLGDPIKSGENVTTEFKFGKFTRATQMGIKVKEQGKDVRVNLNEINFRTMDDNKCNAVLKAMTGISDDSILNGVEVQDFNNLTMIAGYFFG